MEIDPVSLDPVQTPVSEDPGFFSGEPEDQPTPAEPLLPADPDAAPDPVTPVPIQGGAEVAGVGTAILKSIVRGFDAKKGRTPRGALDEAAEGRPVTNIEDQWLVVREAEQADIDEFNTITGQTTGVPSPTPGQKARGVPVSEVNLDRIESPDDIKEVISRMAKMHGKSDTVTADDVKRLAASHGLDDVVEKLLRRKEGDALNMDQGEIYKSLQAITSSALTLNRLAERAAHINAGPQDLIKFRQYFSFHSALQSSMQGLQADASRALGVFKIPRGPEAAEVRGLQNMIDDLGGDNSIREMAKHYLALPTQAQRNRFSNQGFFAKAKSVWFEIWINGLLSGVKTQAVNLTGNALFGFMQPFERALAGGIGGTRRAARSIGIRMPGAMRLTIKNMRENPETVMASEAIDMINTWISASIDGGRIAYQSLKSEQSMFDALSKIETANQRAITAKNLGVEKYGAIGATVDIFGQFIRAPGRLLLTTDEFWKAWNYRVELAAQVNRRVKQMALDGAPMDEIRRFEIEAFRRPPEDIHGRAEEMARINTFTNALGKYPENARKLIHQVPGGRFVMPFFRVIYNLTGAAVERSPLGIVKALRAADPIERDLAYAKAALGSTVMGVAAHWYSEGMITGTGPENFNLRRQMEEIGWKQYSLVRPKVDNPRWVQVGQISFLHPEDVDYISYHRMEPISMILAVASDVSRRLSYPDITQADGENVAIQAVDAIYEYMKDQSFMTGFATVAEAFSRGVKSSGRVLEGIIRTQIPYSTLLSNFQKVMEAGPLHDVSSNPREPMGLRTLYAGLRQMDQRTPFGLDTDLAETPIKRNAFYEPIYSKNARVIDQILPPGVQSVLGIDPEEIRTDPVKLEIVRLGVPLSRPPRIMRGVRLEPWERDQFNLLTNFPKFGDSMYEELAATMKMDVYKKASFKEQQDEIKSIVTIRRAAATEEMLNPANTEYFDLQDRVNKLTTLLEEQGRQVQ